MHNLHRSDFTKLLMMICRRVDDAENIPVSLNVETVKNKGEEGRRKK